MEAVNPTPFPAQAFEAIDQYEQQFHVFVLRQTFDFSSGKLKYADKQQPLCDEDEYFGKDQAGSPRQESDYCPYKPKCDVIVNATAYSPSGKAVPKFPVGLVVTRDGKQLIEKTLLISGERFFRKRFAVARLIQWCVKWGTLSLVRLNPWKLTSPALFTSLPLRAEYSYGGECRVEHDERAARRVPAKYRLSKEQLAAHPDARDVDKKPPVAHVAFDANAAGIGFATDWYLKATRRARVPAPRIEDPSAKFTEKQFWRTQKSGNRNATKLDAAGFGIRSKLHPGRRSLIGELDSAYMNSSAPLPLGFDFGFWNAAPPDQQTIFLTGGDVVDLINLCPPHTLHMVRNARGHQFLSLVLPERACFIKIDGDGQDICIPLSIDTVLIEPEAHALTLVWRLALPKDDFDGIDSCEFCTADSSERNRARYSDKRSQTHGNSHAGQDRAGAV